MSLIVELRDVIQKFRSTLTQLDQDIVTLAKLVDEHFDLNHKPMPKIIPNLEKDLMK